MEGERWRWRERSVDSRVYVQWREDCFVVAEITVLCLFLWGLGLGLVFCFLATKLNAMFLITIL